MDFDPLTSRTADDLLQDHAAFDTDDEDLAQRPSLNTERDDKAILSPRKRKAGDILGDDIADEEVKITKQRRKIPKLDTDKLLSDLGLPKIRGILRSDQLKKKLRLKGKGHEFSDVARLLNFYQMWLDNLYPRAKFADAVQMVEKAGHTKKMQMYRKSWIDEGKPGHVRQDEVDDAFDASNGLASKTQPESNATPDLDLDQDFDEDPTSMFFGGADEPASRSHEDPDDDELEALLAQEESRPAAPTRQPVNVDSEGEDDLDAILAQVDTHRNTSSSASGKQNGNSKTDNETKRNSDAENQGTHTQSADKGFSQEYHGQEENNGFAAPMDQTTLSQVSSGKRQDQPRDEFDGDDFDEDDFDDFDVLTHNQSITREPELFDNTSRLLNARISEAPGPGTEETPGLERSGSSAPESSRQTDDLDQLLDEHDPTTERKRKENDPNILEEFMSSSPIQN